MKKLWLFVVLMILSSSLCFGHIWRDGMQNASTNRGYYGLGLFADGDGFIDVNTTTYNPTFATTGLSVQVYPGDVFTARYQVVRLPANDGVVDDIFVYLNVGGTWYAAPVSPDPNPINDTAVHAITYTFTQAGTLSEIEFDPQYGNGGGGTNDAVVRILDYAITRNWNDDMQDASTNRTYSGLTMVEDGDGYISMRPTIDQPTFTTSNLSVHVNAGDVFTAEYSVPTLPSNDGRVDDVFIQLYIDGAWVSIPSTGMVNDNGTHYITYMFKQASTLTSINFNPQWGYYSGGTSAIIRLSDYTIKPLWHDDMENLSRNYAELHFVRSGEGYIEVAVDTDAPSLCTSLSELVLPGDIITSTWQVSQLPTDDSKVDNFLTQFYIGGVWHDVKRGNGEVNDTKIHTVAYEVTQAGTITDIQTTPQYGNPATGDKAQVKVFNYSVRRPNWNDDLEDASTNRGYWALSKYEDGLGYIDVLCEAWNPTFGTTGLSVPVSVGDVFTAKYQVTRLPSDDGHVNEVFVYLNINGSWYSSSVSDISDTAEHTITYTIPVSGTLTEVDFDPQYGYYSGGNSAIVRIFDYTIMPQYLYMLKNGIEPNSTIPTCFTVLADESDTSTVAPYPSITPGSTSWTPDANDTARGYAVSRVGTQTPYAASDTLTSIIEPNWVPTDIVITADANVVAAPGEFRCVSYAVRSLKFVPGLDVRATDLTSSTGNVIRKANIDIRNTRFKVLDSRWAAGFLEKSLPANIDKSWTAWIWAEVYVPVGTPAGTYNGYMTFFDSEGGTKTSKLRVDVLNFTVDNAQGAFGAYIPGHFYSASIGTYEDWATSDFLADNLTNLFNFWKTRGFTSPTLYFIHPELSYYSATYDDIQKVVDAMGAAGLVGPLCVDTRHIEWWARGVVERNDPCLPGYGGIEVDEANTTTVYTNDMKNIYGGAIQDMLDIAIANNWPDLHLLVEEEVGWYSGKTVAYEAFMPTLLSVAGYDRAYLPDGSIGYGWSYPSGIDRGNRDGLMVRQYNNWTDPCVAAAHDYGTEVWAYNLGWNRYIGLYNQGIGSTGYHQWADHWTTNQGLPGMTWIQTKMRPLNGCLEVKLDASGTTLAEQNLSIAVQTNDVLTTTYKISQLPANGYVDVSLQMYKDGGWVYNTEVRIYDTSMHTSTYTFLSGGTVTELYFNLNNGSGAKVRVYDHSIKRGSAYVWQDDMSHASQFAYWELHLISDCGLVTSATTEMAYEGLRDLAYCRKLEGLIADMSAAGFTSEAAAAQAVLDNVVSDVGANRTDFFPWRDSIGDYELDSRRNSVATQIGLAIATLAAPKYQAAGTSVSGTGNITVAWPTHQTGDVALLFIESCGGQAANLGTPAGFAAVTNSPQSTGTTTNGTRITVYWCRATSSSMASPVVTDPGDHVYGRILTFRGVVASGNPWDVTAGGVKATASTTTTFGTVTTGAASELIVLAASRDNDSTSAAWSSWTNANLTSITERSDGGTTSGNGGGIGVATGIKVAAGAIGSSTATVTSSKDGHMTIALKP